MTRPTRYTENNSSRDWIDEFIATSSQEEVRGAFRFTIGKYLRRYGKKDDPLQEAIKIQDYANRLVAFERELAAPDHVELRRHPMTPNVIEPASEMQDDSERMAAIGQNGNVGEHYGQAPSASSWKDAPDWANWLAMDKNGKWCWFENEPFIEDAMWVEPSLNGAVGFVTLPPVENWENSLERRS